MTARGRYRGNPIYFQREAWRYEDSGTPTYAREDACTCCGKRSEPGGPDVCLGHLPGVRAACCGHGAAERSYIIFYNGHTLRGSDSWELQAIWGTSPMTPGRVIQVYLCLMNLRATRALCKLAAMGALSPDEIVAAAGEIERHRRNSP